MSLTTINVDVRDGWKGTRNIELDGLMIRGDELTIRGCELLFGLIKQSTKRGMSAFFSLRSSPLSYGRPLTLYSFFWTILVLHLLVIHAYTWVHVPSATPSDILWIAVVEGKFFTPYGFISLATRTTSILSWILGEYILKLKRVLIHKNDAKAHGPKLIAI